MTQPGDFEDQVNRIVDIVERIGDSVGNEIQGRTGEGEEVQGYQCEHGDHQYLVIASPAWEHILIRYQFNVDVLWHIHNNLGPNERSEEIEVSQENLQNARRNLESELQSYPNELKKELLIHLKQILGREGCSVQLDTITEPFNIHGFHIDKRVYPDQDGFGIGEFEKSVQNVINFGWTGQDMLAEYYGLPPASTSRFPGDEI